MGYGVVVMVECPRGGTENNAFSLVLCFCLGLEGEVMCCAVLWGFILRWEGCGCGWMDGWEVVGTGEG